MSFSFCSSVVVVAAAVERMEFAAVGAIVNVMIVDYAVGEPASGRTAEVFAHPERPVVADVAFAPAAGVLFAAPRGSGVDLHVVARTAAVADAAAVVAVGIGAEEAAGVGDV